MEATVRPVSDNLPGTTVVTTSGQKTTEYQRIAEAIRFLRAHRRNQPNLAALAKHLELSEYHVQKLFSRWAGISPKRFLQYLTVEFAKTQMNTTGDLLALSLEAGLSGPGRLHDLFVTMEAMTPGEFKRAAAGVRIRYGVGETPFGLALAATTSRGICHLTFIEADAEALAVSQLMENWPTARFEHRPAESERLLTRIFDHSPTERPQPLALWISGSNFQIQVWRALLQIPFAGLLNYRQLAQQLGMPKAARAVGNAVAGNRIAYLIPCHRVLRQTGHFGKYRWDADRKAALVAWEAARGLSECQRSR